MIETKQNTLDMVQLFAKVDDLADLIGESETMETYIECKHALEADAEAQEKIAAFAKKKEDFEEVQRFGKWHPDYERINREMRDVRSELFRHEKVAKFKKAENALEELLFHVSKTIAQAVSETIKVPSDNPMLAIGGSGCGTGGCGTGGGCGCK